MRLKLALFILALFLLPAKAEALVFLFYPIEDSYVKAESPTKNFASEYRLGVGDGWEISNKSTRSFLKFDLSSISGWNVLDAGLGLYHYWSRGIVGDNFNLHRVTEAWNETTVTWNNQPGFSAEISSSITITGGIDWRVWDIRDLVQVWVGGSYTNYGLMIENDLDGSYNEYERLYFRSKDFSNEKYWPKLEVNAVPEPATLLLFVPGLFILKKLRRRDKE